MSGFEAGLLPEAEIPLRNRRGELVSVALVDAEDYERIALLPWYLDGDGYAASGKRIDGRPVKRLMHREVLGLVFGDTRKVDHIDRSAKLDNRKCNLRVGTHAQNLQNLARITGRGTSQYRGVYWVRGRWIAQATLSGRTHWIGVFGNDEEAAAAAVLAWRREHMPWSEEDRLSV